MTSRQIYLDIKEGDSSLSFNYFKKMFLPIIKVKFTTNNCIIEAEERFSFAFVQLYEKITTNEISNINNLKGYFMTTCRNNFLLNASRTKVTYDNEIPYHLLSEKAHQFEILNHTDAVAEMINSLPAKLKSVSEKIYLEDKNHKEVAAELDMNYENVRKYQYKSISIMKKSTPKYFKDLLNVA